MQSLRQVREGNKVELEIDTPRVFFPLLVKGKRYIGARGGRGSGKSWFFATYCVEAMMAGPERIVCVREIQKSIAESAKAVIEAVIEALGVASQFEITDKYIAGPHGSLVTFVGMQNHTAGRFKSTEGVTLVWCEEAQTLSKRSIEILTPTVRAPGSRMLFGWNPDKASDPIEKFFADNKGDPDVVCITANYYDNPWFPDELRRDMERDKRRDPDKYAHVWLGQYKKLSEARVFRNWRIGRLDEFKARVARYYLGGDFGFANDPTVLVRNYIEGRTIFIDREAYAVGCEIDHTPFLWGGCSDVDLQKKNAEAWANLNKTPEGLKRIAEWKGIPEARKWHITADSSRPETISYLKRHGFPLVRGAIKGANSVMEGIEFLKSFDIVVHPDCVHTIDELSNYSFEVDPLTGEVLPKLEDKKNHVIDAARYSVELLRRARAMLS